MVRKSKQIIEPIDNGTLDDVVNALVHKPIQQDIVLNRAVSSFISQWLDENDGKISYGEIMPILEKKYPNVCRTSLGFAYDKALEEHWAIIKY